MTAPLLMLGPGGDYQSRYVGRGTGLIRDPRPAASASTGGETDSNGGHAGYHEGFAPKSLDTVQHSASPLRRAADRFTPCLLYTSPTPTVEVALPEPAWAIWVAWSVVPMTAVLLGLLAATGVLSLRKLEQSPKRDVGLTLLDALAGVWLWFMGSVVVGVLMQGLSEGDSGEAALSPGRILLMQVGVFGPGIAYWLWRLQRTAKYRSLIGFFPRSFARDLRWTLLGLPAIVLLFMATQQIAAVVSFYLGSPPPAVQHDLLVTYAQLRDDGDYVTMIGLLAVSYTHL